MGQGSDDLLRAAKEIRFISCSACGRSVNATSKVCTYCGADMAEPRRADPAAVATPSTVPSAVKVEAYEDEDQASRTVRWLRRSGLRARMERRGEAFEVVVPSRREEREAHRVLQALESTRERTEPSEPTGWGRVRNRLFSIESIGMLLFVLAGVVLLFVIGIGIWAFAGIIGWLALGVVLLAGLVYFAAAGAQVHSAVKSPRRYSHKHDVTMELEQEVQYRLAWARGQYRKSRRWPFRRRRAKE